MRDAEVSEIFSYFSTRMSFIHFLHAHTMNQNIGSLDKIIRIAIAVAMILLYFISVLTSTIGTVALIIGIGLLLTSLTGFCGLYSLLGINTCKVKK